MRSVGGAKNNSSPLDAATDVGLEGDSAWFDHVHQFVSENDNLTPGPNYTGNPKIFKLGNLVCFTGTVLRGAVTSTTILDTLPLWSIPPVGFLPFDLYIAMEGPPTVASVFLDVDGKIKENTAIPSTATLDFHSMHWVIDDI